MTGASAGLPANAGLTHRLAETDLVRRALQGISAADAWLVGGTVRDVVLGRPVADLDLAVAADPRESAIGLAERLDGHAFELSAEHGTWRIVPRGNRTWQIDITRLRGETIEDDLAARDFTLGAIGIPLTAIAAPDESAVLDPFGGLPDIDARIIRLVSASALADDPLRLVRFARLSAELGLEPERETLRIACRDAPLVSRAAGERILEELVLLIGSAAPIRGIEMLGETGVLAEVLPEVSAMRGVEQGPNHHLDVFDHTLEVLRRTMELERDPGSLLTADRMSSGTDAERAASDLTEFFSAELAGGITRGTALRLGALFHDIGKPQTRAERDGFIGFPGHDLAGADLVKVIGRRLRMSRRLTDHLASLALHHLRLGFLVASQPLPARTYHDYLKATGSVAVDVTLLTVADRLSARGSGSIASDEMIEAHLGLAVEMAVEGLRVRREGTPSPLLRGGDIAEIAEIEPGPDVGAMVAELEAAQYAGEITTREQAIAHIRSYRAR